MTDRPEIRILFITSLLDRPGGAEKNFCELALYIDRTRFSPSALVFQGGVLSDFLSNQGIPTRVNHISKLLSYHALGKGLKAYRFMKKEKIDVVVTYHHDADIWGGITAWMARVPVIISSRRDMGYQLRSKHLWFYRTFPFLFDLFLTVSDAVKQKIVRREWIRPEKVKTVYSGITTSLYDRSHDVSEVKKELGIDPGKTIIGSVASFRPVKGQLLVVEAIHEIVKRHENIQIVFVGDAQSEYSRKVRQKIEEWNLREYFLFTGERKDVPRILSAFDIFVLSSESEGFSNAILEAMAAGKPVVAPNNGGNPEAVEHYRTGLLFVEGSSGSLSESLEILLSDNALRESMGARGRRKVAEEFSREKMIREHEALFLSLVSGKRRSHGEPVPVPSAERSASRGTASPE